MLLSIIIPTLNEGRIISETLLRLAPLRARGHEVVVVDGGSTDGTAEAARLAADRVVSGSRGRARQMNRGAHCARGDVLVFLHADTVLPERADAMIATLLRSSGAQWGYFPVRLSGYSRWFRLIERFMNLRTRLTGIVTGDLAMFVRRKAFFSVEGFPDIALMEDIELSRRLKRLGRPMRMPCPVQTSSRRWEQAGILRTVLRMWRFRLQYFLGRDPTLLEREYHARQD